MALKLSLESTGPGRGVLRIGGRADAAESVNLAIQRNDGRYLGLNGQWQPTPYWHPQFSAEPALDGFSLLLGPALLDGIIAMRGAPLRLTVRTDEQEDSGVLRIRGALIGSDAAADERDGRTNRASYSTGVAPAASASASTGASQTDQDRTVLQLDDLADLPPELTADDGRHGPTPSRRHAIWPWLLGVVLLLIIGGGLTAWQLGWHETLFAERAPKAQPDGVATSPESSLTGVAFASDFLANDPPASAILAQAEASAKAGDCDAALLLYNGAAERDASLGVTVARLYDPNTFTEGGCIDVASQGTALEYYLGAAEAGVPEAMQRAGELLTASADSGPLHEQGLNLLKRAQQGTQ